MPRDYKHRPAKRPKRQRDGAPRWAFALGGFGLGLCVAVGAYVEGRHPGTFVTVADSLPIPAGEADIAESADGRPDRPRPRFEFYNLLPEMEVTVPVERPPERTGPKAPQPKPRVAQPEQPAQQMTEAERAARILAGEDLKPAPARNRKTTADVVQRKPSAPIAPAAETASEEVADASGYMLQVGSFRQLSDADRMKAKLALSGHRATIHTARMSDNSERHRVRLGPFPSVASAKRISVRLADSGERPLLIKIDS